MDPDRKELQMAINIYGDNVIARALNKSPSTKEKACQEIKDTLASYSENESQFKPAQMLRGTTQIITRLIRDKVWAIFGHGVALTTSIYENFIFAYPLPRKELAISVEKIQKELLARGCDTTERVMDKAEATLEMMLQNKKVLLKRWTENNNYFNYKSLTKYYFLLCNYIVFCHRFQV